MKPRTGLSKFAKNSPKVRREVRKKHRLFLSRSSCPVRDVYCVFSFPEPRLFLFLLPSTAQFPLRCICRVATMRFFLFHSCADCYADCYASSRVFFLLHSCADCYASSRACTTNGA